MLDTTSIKTESRNLLRGFIIPSLKEIMEHGAKMGPPLPEGECLKFHAFYDSKGWKVGKNPMVSWKSSMVGWRGRWQDSGSPSPKEQKGDYFSREIEKQRKLIENL